MYFEKENIHTVQFLILDQFKIKLLTNRNFDRNK